MKQIERKLHNYIPITKFPPNAVLVDFMVECTKEMGLVIRGTVLSDNKLHHIAAKIIDDLEHDEYQYILKEGDWA